MSAYRYGVRLGAWCARVAEQQGIVQRRAGVHPVRQNTAGGVDLDHDHLVFQVANRSAARQLRTKALAAFDATKPNDATVERSRRADVVRLGKHPSEILEVCS